MAAGPLLGDGSLDEPPRVLARAGGDLNVPDTTLFVLAVGQTHPTTQRGDAQ